MRRLRWLVLAAAVVAILFAVNLATPKTSEAAIHEIVAALCNGGDPLEAPGQERNGNSFLRALQATGFITDIDVSVPGQITVSFDPTVPSSKYKSAGFDLTIPDGIAPGVDLILSPLIIPDPDFAAHKHCPKFPGA